MSRTMLPSDANPYGNVHGGEVMKLIDAVAGAAATRHARARVVTARIDQLSFLAPVYVASAYLVFVATDEHGRPISLPPLLAETDEERRRMRAAETRRSSRLQRPRTS